MTITELARYRELTARTYLTDDETVELDTLETLREQEDERHIAAIGKTYAAIQRDENRAVREECSSLGLNADFK